MLLGHCGDVKRGGDIAALTDLVDETDDARMELVSGLQSSHLGVFVEREAKHGLGDTDRLVPLDREDAIDVFQPVSAKDLEDGPGLAFRRFLLVREDPGSGDHLQVLDVERQRHREVIHSRTDVDSTDLVGHGTINHGPFSGTLGKLTEVVQEIVELIRSLSGVHPSIHKFIIFFFKKFIKSAKKQTQ